MPTQITLYPIMISSPSDLEPERRIVKDIIYQWNHDYGTAKGIHFDPVLFENDAIPLVGLGDGQVIINRILCDPSEIMLAMFWSRVGTPTPRAESGTIEELERYMKDDNKKPILLFFCERDIPQKRINTRQWKSLKRFKKRMGKQGLYYTFKFENDLRKRLTRSLCNIVDKYGYFKKNISKIDGNWRSSDGHGTAIGPDGTFTLQMLGLKATFNNTQVKSTFLTTTLTACAIWEAHQGGQCVRNIRLSHKNKRIDAISVKSETWQYTFPSKKSKITFTLTSNTTANVLEEGIYRLGNVDYQYVATYTMTKEETCTSGPGIGGSNYR